MASVIDSTQKIDTDLGLKCFTPTTAYELRQMDHLQIVSNVFNKESEAIDHQYLGSKDPNT